MLKNSERAVVWNAKTLHHISMKKRAYEVHATSRVSKREHTKRFTWSVWGGRAPARAAALAYRDRLLAEPEFDPWRGERQAHRIMSGVPIPYYVVYISAKNAWQAILSSTRDARTFAVSVYGWREAYCRAVACRLNYEERSVPVRVRVPARPPGIQPAVLRRAPGMLAGFRLPKGVRLCRKRGALVWRAIVERPGEPAVTRTFFVKKHGWVAAYKLAVSAAHLAWGTPAPRVVPVPPEPKSL